MTIDEAIKRYTDNAEYERTHGNLQGCMEFKQLVEWLKELKTYREKQEISTGCVNNHDCNDCIHNSICTWRGAKFCDWYVQDCSDAISRQAVLDMQYRIDDSATLSTRDVVNVDDIENLPPVTPKPKTAKPKIGRWIYGEDNLGTGRDGWYCNQCGHFEFWDYSSNMKSAKLNLPNPCPNCGVKMEEE